VQSRLPASSVITGCKEACAPPRGREDDEQPVLKYIPQQAAQQAMLGWTDCFTQACFNITPEAALVAQHMLQIFCYVLAQRTGVLLDRLTLATN
jgi:hypothetical protein